MNKTHRAFAAQRLLSAALTGLLLLPSLTAAAETIDVSQYDVTSYKAPFYRDNEAMAGIGTVWQYEYSTAYNTDFTPMEKNLGLYSSNPDDKNDAAELSSPWSTDLYIRPGFDNVKKCSINAVQTFVAPEDGYVTIQSCDIIRHYGMNDDNTMNSEVAVFLGEEKIWPEGDGWANIDPQLPVANTLTMPSFSNLKVSKGDRIRFVVGCGAVDTIHWEDITKWYVTVDMFVKKAETTPPTEAPTQAPASSGDTTMTTAASAAGTAPAGSASTSSTAPEKGAPIGLIAGIAAAVVVVAGGGVAVFLVLKKKRGGGDGQA